MLKKNDIFRVGVTDINNLGNGIARVDGMVVFISGAVTGDELDIKIIKAARDYAVARIEAVATPSPYRISSDCSYSNRCGGCVYRNISREYEFELKQSYVKNAFHKAGIDAKVYETVTDNKADGCRNKAQYPVSRENEIGFYARHSHDVVKCDSCRLVPDEFNEILKTVSGLINKYNISGIRHVCMRKGFGTGEIMLILVSYRSELDFKDEIVDELILKHPYIKSIVLNVNDEDTNVILGKKCIDLYGNGEIEDILCGLRFGISALSFYQVNHDMAERLYSEAIERVKSSNPKSVCDLYCGTGTIGLILASALDGIALTGVEIVPEAVENARKNAEKNRIKKADFICADAMKTDVGGYDCIVIDPPRKGMGNELILKLLKEKPKKLVYISCNPDTLVRDAKQLICGGYKMSDVRPFDMFPRTGAIECVTDFTLPESES